MQLEFMKAMDQVYNNFKMLWTKLL